MRELMVIGSMAAFGIYLFKKYGQETTATVDSSQVFPLKKGDKNNLVKSVQKALINRGGESSRLVLEGGGATGIFNESTEKALNYIGYSTTVTQEQYKMLIADSNVLRNIAYVIDVDGAKIFTAVGNSSTADYGYGRDPITTLPVRTHLGTATGNYKNGLIELVTTINVKRVKFWVHTDKIALVSEAEYDMMKTSKILSKSDDVRAKLLKL